MVHLFNLIPFQKTRPRLGMTSFPWGNVQNATLVCCGKFLRNLWNPLGCHFSSPSGSNKWTPQFVLPGVTLLRIPWIASNETNLDGGNSNIFNFYPNLGKMPILTNIFQMGWNHQPVMKGDLPLRLDQIQSWTVVPLNCCLKRCDWNMIGPYWTYIDDWFYWRLCVEKMTPRFWLD